MELAFSCPKCSSPAKITLSNDEVESIKKQIKNEGRSPTLIAKCENGHELLVTLYFRNEELGIRDVMVPIDINGNEKSKVSEIDWLRSTFGGG